MNGAAALRAGRGCKGAPGRGCLARLPALLWVRPFAGASPGVAAAPAGVRVVVLGGGARARARQQHGAPCRRRAAAATLLAQLLLVRGRHCTHGRRCAHACGRACWEEAARAAAPPEPAPRTAGCQALPHPAHQWCPGAESAAAGVQSLIFVDFLAALHQGVHGAWRIEGTPQQHALRRLCVCGVRALARSRARAAMPMLVDSAAMQDTTAIAAAAAR